MSKRFIAIILAGAMTIAGMSAKPVEAANLDLQKLLLGAATVVIIGAAIDHQRKRADKRPDFGPRAKNTTTGQFTPELYSAPRGQSQKHAHVPAFKPVPRQRAVLPEYCLRNVRSHEGPRTVYGHRCMKANYSAFDTLPKQCRSVIHGPNGTRKGFRPGCLYRAGFRG